MIKSRLAPLALSAVSLTLLLPASINATIQPPIELPIVDIPIEPSAPLAAPSDVSLLSIPVDGGQYFLSWKEVTGARYYLIHQEGADNQPSGFVLAPEKTFQVAPAATVEAYQIQACYAEDACSYLSPKITVDLRAEYAAQNPAANTPAITTPSQLALTSNETDCEFSMS